MGAGVSPAVAAGGQRDGSVGGRALDSCDERPPLEAGTRAVNYLLDTNAVSALMKGETAVVARLGATERADVAIPQPVLAEISYGIERLPRSKRRALLQDRFDLVCSEVSR